MAGPEHAETMSTLGDKVLVLVEWKPGKREEHFSGGALGDPKVGDGRGRKEEGEGDEEEEE